MYLIASASIGRCHKLKVKQWRAVDRACFNALRYIAGINRRRQCNECAVSSLIDRYMPRRFGALLSPLTETTWCSVNGQITADSDMVTIDSLQN